MRQKKGQLFIIATIFVILIIILIKNTIGTVDITEENRFQGTRLAEKSLKNIQNEFRNVVSAAAVQPDANRSGMEYLRNTSLQARNDLDASILYVYIVANGTNNKYSVTIGNFLQDRVNVTYNATGSSPGGNVFIVEDKQNATNEYTSSVTGTINVNITYTSQNQDTTERFNITTNAKNNIFLFTDITVRSNDLFVRGKDIYNWSWPV